MAKQWRLVAFPLILPWREEFWTLPLYFPDLRVGVTPGWPQAIPFQGMPLPPEAQAATTELRHYRGGDLRQWQAFQEYQQSREEVEDILRELKGEQPEPEPREPRPSPWVLAWQLEQMQADQEAQMLRVDRGDQWLADILAPEPWEGHSGFGQVQGLEEMVDPELARLRFSLWQRVMAPHLERPWAPLLLGRTSRALLQSVKGWPQWVLTRTTQVSLPGCRNAGEWQKAAGPQGQPPVWQPEFTSLLADLLEAAQGDDDLEGAAEPLRNLVARLAQEWPQSPTWTWGLEIWARDDQGPEGLGPVLCWVGAGPGILPG